MNMKFYTFVEITPIQKDMNIVRLTTSGLLSMALLILAGCSTNGNGRGKALKSDETATLSLDLAGLQGKWLLASYRVDCESMKFESGSSYVLSFNEPDNSFGLTTDCNMIGGNFGITNDTIRFKNIAVTEMACDKMTVEADMLRLLNDTTAYAVCKGDSILYTAPSIGDATFIKSDEASGNEWGYALCIVMPEFAEFAYLKRAR